MTLKTLLDALDKWFAGVQLDEHTILLICIGIIIGFFVMGGHRHVRYHYNRFRGWYGGYRRRYRYRDW